MSWVEICNSFLNELKDSDFKNVANAKYEDNEMQTENEKINDETKESKPHPLLGALEDSLGRLTDDTVCKHKIISNKNYGFFCPKCLFERIDQIEKSMLEEKKINSLENIKFDNCTIEENFTNISNKMRQHNERIEGLEKLDKCLTRDIPFLNKRIADLEYWKKANDDTISCLDLVYHEAIEKLEKQNSILEDRIEKLEEFSNTCQFGSPAILARIQDLEKYKKICVEFFSHDWDKRIEKLEKNELTTLPEYCKNVLEQRDLLISRLEILEKHKDLQIDENRAASKHMLEIDQEIEKIPTLNYVDSLHSRLLKIENWLNTFFNPTKD